MGANSAGALRRLFFAQCRPAPESGTPDVEQGMDSRRAALEAEADRLAGVYLRVKLLAQKRRIAFREAGRAAVAEGLASAEDWLTISEAAGGV